MNSTTLFSNTLGLQAPAPSNYLHILGAAQLDPIPDESMLPNMRHLVHEPVDVKLVVA